MLLTEIRAALGDLAATGGAVWKITATADLRSGEDRGMRLVLPVPYLPFVQAKPTRDAAALCRVGHERWRRRGGARMWGALPTFAR